MEHRQPGDRAPYAVREEVAALCALGPLPDDDAPVERIEQFERLLDALYAKRPVTDDEARVLVHAFGPDDCYGLAWTLLHIIETAPGWPLWDTLPSSSAEANPWVQQLVDRARRVDDAEEQSE